MKWILTLILTTCVANAAPASLGWWLLPDGLDDWPHEMEEDVNGHWKELWIRPEGNPQALPSIVMEQALGAKWVGLNPDKSGKPSRVVAVLAGRRIVDFDGSKVRVGKIEGEDKIVWSDGLNQSLVEFKKSRRHRRRRHGATKIHFGKITLPPVALRPKPLNNWSVERLGDFLAKIPDASEQPFTLRDFSAVAQMESNNGSALRFRYSANCSDDDKVRIEDELTEKVAPRLTCWMEKNPSEASKLLAVLMQKPTIECKAHAPMLAQHCGMATIPYVEDFFVHSPEITLNLRQCKEDLSGTLIHEIFHLTGMRDNPPEAMDKAVEQSESCEEGPASVSFENPGEEFQNDFQVETRIFLFRNVREQAVEKWGWSEAEKAFFLGTLCSAMGDKYCSRRFFQQAAEGGLTGMVALPEGTEVTWSSMAQFGLFDSVSEDLLRMHELMRYLHRDPNGTLLRRLETGTHRAHEFFVARSALEAVQNNKGVCRSETEDRILCEDLAQLVKTPWFKN